MWAVLLHVVVVVVVVIVAQTGTEKGRRHWGRDMYRGMRLFHSRSKMARNM